MRPARPVRAKRASATISPTIIMTGPSPTLARKRHEISEHAARDPLSRPKSAFNQSHRARKGGRRVRQARPARAAWLAPVDHGCFSRRRRAGPMRALRFAATDAGRDERDGPRQARSVRETPSADAAAKPALTPGTVTTETPASRQALISSAARQRDGSPAFQTHHDLIATPHPRQQHLQIKR